MNRQRKPVLVTIGVFTLAGLVTALLQAQPGRIGIELTPVTEADAAHAGTTYHVALQARLDPGFHVNSNEPLEDFLIPTVFLLHPPDGIRVEARAWPTPIMLEQFGADQPLAVFEEEFVIGAALHQQLAVFVEEKYMDRTMKKPRRVDFRARGFP